MRNPPLNIDEHKYHVHLIPADMAPDDVEKAYAAKLLPVRELLAPDADWAAKSAHHITGLAVHSVERVDGTDTTLDELETNFDRVADRLTAAGKSGSDPTWTPGCGRAPAPVHTLRCTAFVYGEQA